MNDLSKLFALDILDFNKGIILLRKDIDDEEYEALGGDELTAGKMPSDMELLGFWKEGSDPNRILTEYTGTHKILKYKSPRISENELTVALASRIQNARINKTDSRKMYGRLTPEIVGKIVNAKSVNSIPFGTRLGLGISAINMAGIKNYATRRSKNGISRKKIVEEIQSILNSRQKVSNTMMTAGKRKTRRKHHTRKSKN